MTGHEMCEYAARYLGELGIAATPDALWNYSPTGELTMVYDLYFAARCYFDAQRIAYDEREPWMMRLVDDPERTAIAGLACRWPRTNKSAPALTRGERAVSGG